MTRQVVIYGTLFLDVHPAQHIDDAREAAMASVEELLHHVKYEAVQYVNEIMSEVYGR